MADKKQTAAEKQAAEEAAGDGSARRAVEKQRLMWAGAVLAAVTLFVGGYAVGNAADDEDDVFTRADIEFDEPRSDPFPGRDRAPERRRDRFPGRERFPDDFEFRFPDDFDFPEDFDFRFPEGFERCFEFRFDTDGRPEGRFHFPEECRLFDELDIPFPEDFEFRFPEDFELPFPRDFFDEEGDPEAAPAEAGFLGVEVVEGPEGVVIADVLDGSAAATAGLVAGDVIVEVAGRPIDSVDDLAGVVAGAGAGTEVEVFVLRGDRAISFGVVLGERPN